MIASYKRTWNLNRDKILEKRRATIAENMKDINYQLRPIFRYFNTVDLTTTKKQISFINKMNKILINGTWKECMRICKLKSSTSFKRNYTKLCLILKMKPLQSATGLKYEELKNKV